MKRSGFKQKTLEEVKATLCKQCGASFEKRSHNQVYCGEACRVQSLYDSRPPKHGNKWKKEIRKCKHCLKKFKPKNHINIFCQRSCTREYYSLENMIKNPDIRNDSLKYSWLKLRIKVFDRDNFTCQYCGRSPQKHSVVLHCDHKIPKNKGGKDTLENLITACEQCNLGKTDLLLKFWQNEKN